MTDIEQKALELVNAVGVYHYPSLAAASLSDLRKALCRVLEAHELDKSRHAAEMREQAERFSEFAQLVAEVYPNNGTLQTLAKPFILPPDPLAEVVREALSQNIDMGDHEISANLRAAADRLGYAFTIVKKETVNG